MASPRIDPATVVRLIANRLDAVSAQSAGHVIGLTIGDKPPAGDLNLGAGTSNPAHAVFTGAGLMPVDAHLGGTSTAVMRVRARFMILSPATATGIAGLTAWYSAAGHVARLFEGWSTNENPSGGAGQNGHVLDMHYAAYPEGLSSVAPEGDSGGGTVVGDLVITGLVQRDAWAGESGSESSDSQETVGGGS